MELLSKIFLIFASLFHTEQRHRGELFGFEPSENLENSMCTGKRSESCSPAVAYIQPSHFRSRLTYIPAGVSRFFILTYTGIPEPSDKECHEGSHPLCVCLSLNLNQY